MLEIMQKLLKKIEELKKIGIIDRWNLGTIGYDGTLELEFSGEIIGINCYKIEDAYKFSDYIMIDENAMEELEKKFIEITESAKSYFE